MDRLFLAIILIAAFFAALAAIAVGAFVYGNRDRSNPKPDSQDDPLAEQIHRKRHPRADDWEGE